MRQVLDEILSLNKLGLPPWNEFQNKENALDTPVNGSRDFLLINGRLIGCSLIGI